MPVVREVAAHDHQGHPPLVLLDEVAHRPPVAVQDPETERPGALASAAILRRHDVSSVSPAAEAARPPGAAWEPVSW